MRLREEETKLQQLLKDTITLLCKNGLQFSKGLSIDALIGITTDDASTFLVKQEETVSHDAGDDNTESENRDGDVGRGRSTSSRKRPPGKATSSSSSKRHRSDDDNTDDGTHSDNDANAGNYDDSIDDTDKDNKCVDALLMKHTQDEQNDRNLLCVKQERCDDDGPFALVEQSLADDTLLEVSSFDGGSRDGLSTSNQSSATIDPNASGSQQVRKLM